MAWTDDARKLRLMEWVTTLPEDRDPKTTAAIAEELGVSPRTIRGWKADKQFRDEWERRSRELAGEPEKVQIVLHELFKAATGGGKEAVPAATAFLKAVGAIAPPPVKVEVSKAAASLSDEELQALIAEGARRQLEGRGGAA